MRNLDSFQFDVLKEIGNIGAGNAATALSTMISKEIDMRTPQVRILGFNDISESIGGAENVVVSVLLRLQGDIHGNMFFILSMDSAKSLLRDLLGIDHEGYELTEMETSALNEVGNILVGSYLASLSNFTQLNLQPSIPAVAVDMAGAILGYGLSELGDQGDYALTIDTEFLNGDEKIDGHFFLLPEPSSIDKIFRSLGVPTE